MMPSKSKLIICNLEMVFLVGKKGASMKSEQDKAIFFSFKKWQIQGKTRLMSN
jgi:hypothetical protein